MTRPLLIGFFLVVAALATTDDPHAAGSASALLGASRFAFGAAAPLVGVAGRATAIPPAVATASFGAVAVSAVAVARRTAPAFTPVRDAIGSPA